MKRIVVSVLLSSLILSACSRTASTQTFNDDTLSESTETEMNDLSELEAMGDVKIEKKIFDVKLTIPKEYVEETQEELNKTCIDKGYKSITLNDDGSATYIMTKSQHKELMGEMSENINASLNDLIGSEEYPNFTDISADSNYSKFTVVTKSKELDMNESFSVLMFYMYGGVYNIFNGTPIDSVNVEFVNADTGSIISSSNSKDMNNTQ